MASERAFQPDLRLHPLSWVFVLTNSVRQFLFPIVAFVFVGARNDGELWGLLVLIPLVLAALWRQWIYRYGFGPSGLVIQDGLLFRNVRLIEYPRIENVDVERGPLHRLFGVAQVSIATSTGGKAEASIRVLSLDAVRELRERIFERRDRHEQTTTAAPETEAVLLHVPPAELVRYGLIDNRGLIVVAAFFGFLMQNDSLIGLMVRSAGNWLRDSPWVVVAALGWAMQAALAFAVLIAVILLLRLFSIGIALVTLYDFTLTRREGDFRVRHGLLTRVTLTLRVRRIQAVHQTASLLHRVFGRVSLRVDLAGDSAGTPEDPHRSTPKARWLAPICTPAQARELIAKALPDADLSAEPDWQPLARGARARMFRRSVYLCTLLGTLAVVALLLIPQAPFQMGLELIALFAILVLALSWVRAHVYVRNTRWALTKDAIYFRHGWLTRRLVIAPRNRLQSVTLAQSPFDLRSAMASVALDTAGGTGMRYSIRIPMLAVRVAQELANALYRSPVSDPNRHVG